MATPLDTPGRFHSTVAFYERYRLGYPERLIQRVIALTGLAPGDPVLDLGTGPGLLAVPFAQAGMKVIAADPETAMLDAAAAAARAAGVSLELWHGSSYHLAPSMGPYRLVTMGRSFHWMDRAATLSMLDRIIVPDGAVALFHDEHPDTQENRWFKALREIGDRYGRADEPHVIERKSPHYRRHDAVLLDSPFNVLDGISVVIRRTVTFDDVVGRAFSLSTCSRHKLGERAAAFEAELRAALTALSPTQALTEIAEIKALVARRPSSQAI